MRVHQIKRERTVLSAALWLQQSSDIMEIEGTILVSFGALSLSRRLQNIETQYLPMEGLTCHRHMTFSANVTHFFSP
jgi:hypothetical protein